MKTITPNQIKQNNRQLIYKYIYEKRNVSLQDLSYELHLSRPTVTSNVTALEKEGLIMKSGQIDTEYVGRKAAAYSVNANYRIAIGVEILNKEVKMIAVNLYGEKIDRMVYKINYENQDSYYENICGEILKFKDSLKVNDEQVLGAGFAMQGLVSPDRQTILYGKILSCTGLSISALNKYIPFPCSFIHDADSAAVAELWITPELQNVFYLSLSKHLGAAIISKGEIIYGKHGHSATIEHIQIKPDGALCYCGKRGCLETLCSLNSLLNEDETIEDFFETLKNSEESSVTHKRWNNYLSNLARMINLLHLVYDTDFILGGYLAQFLDDLSIKHLHSLIKDMTSFPEEPDFIQISKMPKHNIAIGAALPYIQDFLSK